MTSETKEILGELKAIRAELDYIKDNMAEKDMFLTPEEKQLVEASYLHEKEGKLFASKDLRKQIDS